MRVALLNLTRGGLSGGYLTYLRELMPLLRKHPSITEILFVGPEGFDLDLPNLKVLSTGRYEHLLGYPRIKNAVAAWKPDVVFIPTARWMDCGAPCVMMIRNMEPMLSSSGVAGIRAWVRNRIAAFTARRAVMRAARVIAVSSFVHDYVVSKWNIDSNRVGVVRHGVSAAVPSPVPCKVLRDLAERPFLFAAGSLLPYRGLEDVVKALYQLGEMGLSIEFVIAGEGSNRYRARIERLAARLSVADRLRWVGRLSASDMAWAYRACSAFIMSSRIEACPNTALEAMAQGAAIISTTCLPMPEFFESAASYYEAGNAQQLADRIRDAVTSSRAHRSAQSTRARIQAEKFTWTETAQRTVEELSRVCSNEHNVSRVL